MVGERSGLNPHLFLLRRIGTLLMLSFVCFGCMKYGPLKEEHFDFGPSSGKPREGVFILHEGRFTYGEASLSYYVPASGQLENEVFIRANGIRLGDVAQSVSIRGDEAWIAVNNSGAVFVVDIDTFRIKGLVEGIPSPRYIHFVSDRKAYVTGFQDSRIAIVDPTLYKVTGHIDTGSHNSTEQMAAWSNYLFVTCWSYDNTILVIDTDRDEIIDEITTPIQPRWIAADGTGRIWALTDGGYKASGYGYEAPALLMIDPEKRAIEKRFHFALGDSPKGLAVNGAGDRLYFLNRHLYSMAADADELPSVPVFRNGGATIYYALGVDPVTSEIYIGDAVDYSQRGVIYRLAPDGALTETFRTAIIPNNFCFKYPQ